VDAGGTGRSGGAGRGHMQVCYSCNGVGHKADVCPNNTANWSENPNLVESHVARTTRLRSLSQQFINHVTTGLQLDDNGYFYDAETGKWFQQRAQWSTAFFFPGSWRSQKLSSAIIMEIDCSSIQFKSCAMGTAFLHKIMESPRGSSVIIMEIGC